MLLGRRCRRLGWCCCEYCLYILQIELYDESLEFLPRQNFREAICLHFACRYPVDIDMLVLYLLSQPVLMNIHVSQSCCQEWRILFKESDSLRIVTKDRESSVYLEINAIKESLHL